MNHGRLRVLVLMLTDALTLGASWFAVSGIYLWLFTEPPYNFRYITSRWGFGAIYLACNLFTRLYHGNPFYPGMALSPVEEFRRLTLTTIGTGILFFAYLSFYGKTSPLPAWVIMATVLCNILLAQPMRNLMRRLLRHLRLAQLPIILIGPPKEAAHLTRILAASAHAGLAVERVFVNTKDAIKYARERDIKHCISCQPLRVFRAAMDEMLRWFSVVVSLPEPRVFPIAMSHPVEFSGYGGVEFANQLRQKGVRAAKRFSEAVLAILAGCALLLPCVAIVLVLWCAYGKKGIFYSTTRLGKGGKPFTLYKFRSMVPDAEVKLAEILANDPVRAKEWKETYKFKDDPRVTKIGAWLRKTSLDEIPQLLNVLRGEMALIGPRPITAREKNLYGAFYPIVAMVKPGITGLWQVSGRSDVQYDARVALDLYYAQNWNPWLDAWICIQTVNVVIQKKGAC